MVTRSIPCLAASVALALAFSACSTASTKAAANEGTQNASPAFFDLTKQPEAEEGDPIDPKTCKHVFVAVGTRPYWTVVNGMRMMRMGYIHRCSRCGLVQPETKRVLGGR